MRRKRGRSAKDTPRFQEAGFSFAELMIVIAVIGVLAGLLIPMFLEMLPSAKWSTADANLKLLNQAVLRFNQASKEIVVAEVPAGTTDEDIVTMALQYRGPDATATVGSPFLDPTFNIAFTADVNAYRASWNGRMFEMIPAGTPGSGVDLLKMASTGTKRTFPNGYTPY